MTKFNQFKCWIKYKVFHVKRTSEQTQEFWNTAKNDNWETYTTGIEKSQFLYNLTKMIPINFDSPILELGCNVGRNLNYLSRKGYNNLFGVELNRDAVKNKLSGFAIANSSIENYFENYNNQFKLIFTMAVLEHLPKESEWVFKRMVQCSKHILTIEDEHSINKICFPRNYKKIFESLGMEEIYSQEDCTMIHPTFTKGFRARVFQHKS